LNDVIPVKNHKPNSSLIVLLQYSDDHFQSPANSCLDSRQHR
ncbi:393_t:CDS:1, partial [Funneliformis geosporum]